jgi:hypothetical protein
MKVLITITAAIVSVLSIAAAFIFGGTAPLLWLFGSLVVMGIMARIEENEKRKAKKRCRMASVGYNAPTWGI